MLETLITNDEYASFMLKTSEHVLSYLLENGVEFGVICNTEEVFFDPQLPEDIFKTIKPIALFVLSNYSFESASLDTKKHMLFFEAGFGSDNFASLVGIDISSIIQVVVEDAPIFINVCAGQPRKSKKMENTTAEATASTERSMEKFLSRPENKKFLK